MPGGIHADDWTSPGMVDTQLRVYNHPGRSIMARKRRSYTLEFKAEAVKLVTEQGYSVAEAARSLGVHETLLRSWKQALQDQADQAFPAVGRHCSKNEKKVDNGNFVGSNPPLDSQREATPTTVLPSDHAASPHFSFQPPSRQSVQKCCRAARKVSWSWCLWWNQAVQPGTGLSRG